MLNLDGREKKLVINIKELCKSHNITMSELARLSDIEPAKISALANGKRQRIQISHIEKICSTLNITDANEIFTIANIDE
ncbi:helix-turn-helix transcriptional regulator [Listeria booriae]|uniref:Helix-turn-helix transcriptional regulator n=1 Tax=Listeria booriae TaxID=1552123 RepID=A0A7X1CDI9_9LIST|nr:helix-turn-helix transcriptional regulator [Listeria booriae]MBC1493489.1 helix-turn-helix transcriptional regulator [Listeria booriae]MBC1505152.1 helix-turn-helix transcriptional regulator [Listeria booriae]MBC1514096.1 helix-turn-helix transcriptional regulator [Listeria booriae]MBC1945106.1 helix-turn-helix transcriptional regulator [Listeria booriae]MBC6136267.1 helix-turn-helix transcriptional regulator [Listeria booriae]